MNELKRDPIQSDYEACIHVHVCVPTTTWLVLIVLFIIIKNLMYDVYTAGIHCTCILYGYKYTLQASAPLVLHCE